MDKFVARNLLKKGIFAVIKPKNIYSMEVIERLKEIVQKEFFGSSKSNDSSSLKMGHGGILDFSASGVLVIGIGYGCKSLSAYLKCDKRYSVIGKLGQETDTFNDTGRVLSSKSYDHITEEMISNILKSRFRGTILQTPPKFSALKRHGKRVSDLVLEGKEVEMKPRKVDCHFANCLKFSPPYFQLDVSCGGGFYIRSLIHDLGKELESCAHVTELRRTQQGPFSEHDALDESDWNTKNILEAIAHSKSTLKKQKQAVW